MAVEVEVNGGVPLRVPAIVTAVHSLTCKRLRHTSFIAAQVLAGP